MAGNHQYYLSITTESNAVEDERFKSAVRPKKLPVPIFTGLSTKWNF